MIPIERLRELNEPGCGELSDGVSLRMAQELLAVQRQVDEALRLLGEEP